MANARQYVNPPAFTPIPHGLLSTLGDVLRTPSNPHWQMGVTYEPLCGAINTTFDDCIAVTGAGLGTPVQPSPPKIANESVGRRGATPFTVYSEIDCSAVGFWDNAEQSVGDALMHNEQFQVEQTFWTGIAGGQQVAFPHLQANAQILDESSIVIQTAATQISGGVALDIVEGLGRLESAVEACYDGVAVIHVPTVLGPAMAANMLLIPDGPRYRTPNGNIVVLGAGYRGTGPSDAVGAAAPANTAWIYATGAMFIYRSKVTVLPIRESLDRAENTIKAIAERTYVLGWDCCHFAVQISLGGVITGTSGSPV